MTYDPVIKIDDLSLEGRTPETHLCVDCGVDTAPGCPTRKQLEAEMLLFGTSQVVLTGETEMYMVKDKVWKRAGMEPMGGCLCIGCLEKRIGRKLRARDFTDHVFNGRFMPATQRLRDRRGH